LFLFHCPVFGGFTEVLTAAARLHCIFTSRVTVKQTTVWPRLLDLDVQWLKLPVAESTQ